MTSIPGWICATSTRERRGTGPPGWLHETSDRVEIGQVNLHDWIDELSDALDIDAEVDEALILDLARAAAQNVQKTAAPITTYLLGVAAGASKGNPEAIEALAAKAYLLAESWDRPAGAPDPDDVDDDVPDDSGVDHSGEHFDDEED